jgi:hypothetical protein
MTPARHRAGKFVSFVRESGWIDPDALRYAADEIGQVWPPIPHRRLPCDRGRGEVIRAPAQVTYHQGDPNAISA